MQEETKFKKRVLRDLQDLEPLLWHIKTQEVARRGTPDFLICAAGTFIAWELKTDDGEESALQGVNRRKINKAGGVARVVTPSNYNEELKLLRGILYERR